MRAAYLAQDRPDLQVATRSLAQGLQRPTTSHMLMLKRVARYLRYRPRMSQFLSSSEQAQSFCDVVWCWPRWMREDEEERVRRRLDGRWLLYQDLFLKDTELLVFRLERVSITLLWAVPAICWEKLQPPKTGVCNLRVKFSWMQVQE